MNPFDGTAVPALSTEDVERLFPRLTPAQIARLAVHGRRRATTGGEVLMEVAQHDVPFFVVVSGALEIVRPSTGADTIIVTAHAGQFSGETNMITGRRSLVRIRVSEPGEVLELSRDQLLAIIQGDAELSEILMRTFIHRRVSLIARGSRCRTASI